MTTSVARTALVWRAPSGSGRRLPAYSRENVAQIGGPA